MSDNDNKRIIVTDSAGTKYTLGKPLGQGGQGAVFAVENPNLAVKLYRITSSQMRRRLEENIAYLRRLPLSELKVVRPLRVLEKPHCGYVMEIMKDMVPLSKLIDIPRSELSKSGLWYVQTGGLKRRLQVLTSAARTLHELHAQGLAYGDPSPSNFFISSDMNDTEVWLIDIDNLTDGRIRRSVFTPGYAAPELLENGPAGTLTDTYAFAIIAYRMLVQRHPFIGDVIEDGEPELEAEAFAGRLAWIDDLEGGNVSSRGIPRDWVLSQGLRMVFWAMFTNGRSDQLTRPGLVQLIEALESAADACVTCTACRATFLGFPPTSGAVETLPNCPWCDAPTPEFVVARTLVARQTGNREKGDSPRMRLCLEPEGSNLDGECQRETADACLTRCLANAELTAQRRVIQSGMEVNFSSRDLTRSNETHPLLTLTFKEDRIHIASHAQSGEWVLTTHKGAEYALESRERRLNAMNLNEQVWIGPAEPKGLYRAITLKYYPGGGNA